MHGNVIDSMVELMTKNKRTDSTVPFNFEGLRYAVDAFIACFLISAFTIVQMDRNIQNIEMILISKGQARLPHPHGFGSG